MKCSPAELAYSAVYRASHKEEKAAYYQCHKEETRARHREYYAENRERVLARQKEHYANHRPEKHAYYLAHEKEKRGDDRRLLLALMRASVGCAVCGTEETLGYHHRDPATKLFNIADRVLAPWSELMSEIVKCDVLCRSHHMELHMGMRALAA